MLKIVIADDDKIIRNGLRSIIEKNTDDCRVVGEADNGLSALELLQQLKPDLLITDIKMPVMNGVELTRQIKMSKLSTRVIILSGFKDFSYVRDAMKYGAVDYLLKPIENNSLLDLIRQISNNIQSDIQQENASAILIKKINETLATLKENLMLRIINHEEYYTSFQQLGLDHYNRFIFAIASMDESSSSSGDKVPTSKLYADSIKKGLCASFSRYVDEGKILVYSKKHSVFMLCFDGNEDIDAFEQDMILRFSSLHQHMQTRMKGSTTIGLSRGFSDAADAGLAYEQALSALIWRFYEGKNKTICYRDDIALLASEVHIAEFSAALGKHIDMFNSHKSIKLISDMLDYMETQKPSPAAFKTACTEVFSNVVSQVHELLHTNKIDYENMLNHLQQLDTLEELKKYYLDVFTELLNTIRRARSEKNKRKIEIVKEYIRNNYDKKIGLNSISKIVCLNPNYLSNLFKTETGCHFIDYVIQIRIEEAKKLLEDPKNKIYEVGLKVGYEEPVSFNRAFKKIMGVSPAEYRKIISNL